MNLIGFILERKFTIPKSYADRILLVIVKVTEAIHQEAVYIILERKIIVLKSYAKLED